MSTPSTTTEINEAAPQPKKQALVSPFRASILFGMLTLIVYGLSLLKTIFVTRYFGTSPQMDAFAMAVLVPNMLSLLMTGSSAISLIPALALAERQSSGERGNTFRGALVLFFFVSILLSIAIFAFAGPIVRLIAPGFDPFRQALATHLLALAAPLIFCNALYALSSAELLSRRKHGWVASGPAISVAISFAMLIVFKQLGVVVLVYGLVLGAAIQSAVVTWPAWQSNRADGSLRLFTPHIKRIASAQIPLLFVSSFGVANVFVDQGIAGFLPAGNVSALNYASTLNLMVVQIVVMAASWVILPEFSELVAAGELRRLRERARTYIRGLAILSAPVCVLVLVGGDLVIKLLFEHGSFGPRSTALVYATWAGYTIGLVPLSMGMMAARLANALGCNSVLMKIGLLTLPVNAVLDYVLMLRWGCFGISLSTSLVYAVSTVVVFVWVHKKIGVIVDRVTWNIILSGVAACTIAALAFVGVRYFFRDHWTSLTLGALFSSVLLIGLYASLGLIAYMPADVQKCFQPISRLLNLRQTSKL